MAKDLIIVGALVGAVVALVLAVTGVFALAGFVAGAFVWGFRVMAGI